MMFKLVAFIFAITNPTEPIGGLTYNRAAFPSPEACGEFIKSDEGQAMTLPIRSAAENSQRLRVALVCVATEDNTI